MQLLLSSYQPDSAVVWGGRLVGIVTRERALALLRSTSDDPPVGTWLERDVPTLPADLTLDEALARLAELGASNAAVVDAERYLGLVTGVELTEALAIAAATGEGRPTASEPQRTEVARS